MKKEKPDLLSAFYSKTASKLARCPNCGKEYTDDIPAYGALRSPCCPEYALERGIEADSPKKSAHRSRRKSDSQEQEAEQMLRDETVLQE